VNRVTEVQEGRLGQPHRSREEAAAIRSHANTAAVGNKPIQMRLRELEVLEKVAVNSKLNMC
jgi:hypothetical protein